MLLTLFLLSLLFSFLLSLLAKNKISLLSFPYTVFRVRIKADNISGLLQVRNNNIKI